MAKPTTRQHATPDAAPSDLPEPSLAERARTLMHLGRIGSLSTISQKQPGWPFGSVMPYGLDERGRPTFLISTMAMHTKNMLADARASLLVMQPDVQGDPLGAARVTLMGTVEGVPKGDLDAVRKGYLARHDNARYWVDFNDFGFYRLETVDVYHVGGFGVMGWVAAADYRKAGVDPLADAAPAMMQKLNTARAADLVAVARRYGNVQAEEARLTAMDRLGFHLRLRAGDRVQGGRIAFPRAVADVPEAESMFEEMVKEASKPVRPPA